MAEVEEKTGMEQGQFLSQSKRQPGEKKTGEALEKEKEYQIQKGSPAPSIGREHVKAVFQEYTSRYDCEDEKIRLKVEHTYRVAQLCEDIAESLGLSQEDVELAWLIGMLHDIGRFEQLRQYGTFSDAQSIDHAQYGVKILFEEGKLRDYISFYEKDEIIKAAIWNHSAYRLPPELDEKTLLFCRIIRDADKIDILKVTCDVPLESIYDVSSRELYQSQVTPQVMDAFFEHHAILRSLKKTPVDNVVGHVALVFELEYTRSYEIVAQQGYLNQLLQFSTENPETKKQFVELRHCMEEYLQKTCKAAAETLEKGCDDH